jgi:MFS family permease
LSFIGAIWALHSMRFKERQHHPERKHDMLRGMKDGFTYAFGFKPIRYTILLLAVVSLMGMSYSVLLPIFAKDILHGGPETMGFLMGATGTGALCGALYLALRKTVLGLERVIAYSSGLLGAGLLLLSFSTSFLVSMFILVGLGMTMQMASSNTVLQTLSDDDKRGRVMSIYTMAFMGMAPFGSLLAGGLASGIGAQWAVAIGGITCIAGSLVFTRELADIRKMMHPIYLKKGIIKEIAQGIGEASRLTTPAED